MIKKIGQILSVIIQIIIIFFIIGLIFIAVYFFLYRNDTAQMQVSLAQVETQNPIPEEFQSVKNTVSNILSNIQPSTINDKKETNEDYTNYEINIDSKNYYASQLDNYAKIIYNELYNNKENLKTGTYDLKMPQEINNLLYEANGDAILNNAFQDAWDAFVYDNPDMFFIDTSKVCLTTQVTTIGFKKSYEVSITKGDNNTYLKNEYTNIANLNTALQQIENVKKEIISKCSGTDLKKIEIVHDWLIDNLEYDTTTQRDNSYNIYGAFVEKKVVCEGYSKAFKVLMDELNIPCILVKGEGTNTQGQTEKHMWNYVFLNQKWYAIDVTWDDPVIQGNGYVSNSIHYNYYLKGSNEFLSTHKETGQISLQGKIFTYPILSENNF